MVSEKVGGRIGVPSEQGKKTVAKGMATAKKKRETDWEPVPGYTYREINGFRLLIHNTVLEEHEKSTDRRKPLEALELELTMLVCDLPPKAADVVRRLPIWVQWNEHRERMVGGDMKSFTACYHPGNKLTQRYRYDTLEKAVKSNCMEILTMKSLTAEHQGEHHRCVLLHEFTHAVHYHLFDYENPHIKAAYAQAKSKKLYEGRYAIANEKEYFAEVSCAYFDHLDYPPHTREELKKYDRVGYRMMELTWGTPEEIEQAQKPEKEKAAMQKFTAAKRLLGQREKRQEVIGALQAILAESPNTPAAREAEKLLNKIKR